MTRSEFAQRMANFAAWMVVVKEAMIAFSEVAQTASDAATTVSAAVTREEWMGGSDNTARQEH